MISTHTLRGERDDTVRHQILKYTISTHTLRGERDLIMMKTTKKQSISTHTLRGERDDSTTESPVVVYKFQLTRSVGSVTPLAIVFSTLSIFQLTRSVGSVTNCCYNCVCFVDISTHTLRGERDYQ